MSGLLQLCEMAKDSEFWVTNLTCWWTIMVWKILASWFFLVHFQGPEGYSPTFQTRTRILCLGDTFETQLPSSGSSCFPWISFCSDRPASLTSHLKGRSETGSVRLSERKESHNIPGHFYSSVFWVTDIDQALEQGRLTFYSLVGMKWGQRKGKQREQKGIHCPGVCLWSQNWTQDTVWGETVYAITYLTSGGQLRFILHSIIWK